MKEKVVAVSGGFDPLHVGHVRLFEAAKDLGDELIVFLNSDQFLLNKKEYVFMPFEERKEVIESLRAVDRVVEVIDQDHTVCETLRKYKPNVFANGGDRKEDNIPEYDVCNDLGIEMVFNVGNDGKSQSSSWLVNKVREHP